MIPEVPPAEVERDLTLGRFMDAWSQLEANLRSLLGVLSGAPPETAFSIAAAIPDNGRMHDLLLALGDLQLEEADDRKELKELCQHLLISNRYRNSIVHGQWVLTDDRTPPSPFGFALPSKAWVRVYTMIDKIKEFFAVIGEDEKAREQYVFTVDRLKERTTSARGLSARISAFSERIKGRVRLPTRGP